MVQLRSRRYLGSKTKLLPFIEETIGKHLNQYDTFIDLFSGTGVVAEYFSKKGKKVILNDILAQNVIIYNAFFGKELFDKTKVSTLITEYNNVSVNKTNYFHRNFSQTYFSEENSKKIGYIREDIQFKFDIGEINHREKDILITSLLYAMDRIANTVGHYDAYRRTGDMSKKLIMGELEIDNSLSAVIYNSDANELVKSISGDVVYIDPPYNSRQYSDAYHLLENVATWAKPKVFGVAKKMDRSHIKSKYCTSSAVLVFENLVSDIKAKLIVVSYNNTGEHGAGRSQAKITDNDILTILRKKGKVTIYEKDYGQFTTGKSKVRNHKERLFVCEVGGKSNKTVLREEGILIKSPLNYTGGKYKLLRQILPKFPNNIGTFIDLFGGGFNVGVNVVSDKIVYNDSQIEVSRVIKLFSKYDERELSNKISDIIATYGLSRSDKNSYQFYDCNSDSGLGSYNKPFYYNLRNDYNNMRTSIKKDLYLLTLIIYAFNNQIRFNSSKEYNMPVGKRDFNLKIQKNLKYFSRGIFNSDIEFYSKQFHKIDTDEYYDPFVYCDPPYLLGTASYNESGGWTEKDELKLYSYLETLDKKKVKFALSNVIEHKGQRNELLLDWCLSKQFNISYLNHNYNNSNYQTTSSEHKTVEVLITNY